MLEQGIDALAGEAKAAREGGPAHHCAFHRLLLSLAEVFIVPQNTQEMFHVSFLALVQLIWKDKPVGVGVVEFIEQVLQ